MLDDYTSKVSFLAGCLVVVSLFISWYLKGDPMVRPFCSYIYHFLTTLHHFQLDAIPTVGFSDPILSYLSALQFYFNGVPMLKEGYGKVICLTSYVPSRIKLMMLLLLDKTRSIQNCRISEMDGAGMRV